MSPTSQVSKVSGRDGEEAGTKGQRILSSHPGADSRGPAHHGGFEIRLAMVVSKGETLELSNAGSDETEPAVSNATNINGFTLNALFLYAHISKHNLMHTKVHRH